MLQLVEPHKEGKQCLRGRGIEKSGEKEANHYIQPNISIFREGSLFSSFLLNTTLKGALPYWGLGETLVTMALIIDPKGSHHWDFVDYHAGGKSVLTEKEIYT